MAGGRKQMSRKAVKVQRAEVRRPVRYAVIGLGHIAQAAVLPAFGHAKRNSRLAALVSGSATKLKTLGRRYRVARLCDYGEADALFKSGEIDAVYIALPNDLHKEWAVRAARAGLHVLCEKPMAVTARDCEAMIRAAAIADVELMVAYRLHFEAGTGPFFVIQVRHQFAIECFRPRRIFNGTDIEKAGEMREIVSQCIEPPSSLRSSAKLRSARRSGPYLAGASRRR